MRTISTMDVICPFTFCDVSSRGNDPCCRPVISSYPYGVTYAMIYADFYAYPCHDAYPVGRE